MFRRILAGTDGSDSASLAVRHAVELAGRLAAELTVVSAHARAEAGAAPGRGGPADAQADIARALLRDVESAFGSSVRLKTRTVEGAAWDVLVGLADAEGHDLVVVGNRGLRGASRLSAGSVPGRVSRRAPTPVLVVDTMGLREPVYRKILVGTDGAASGAFVADLASELAAALEAELTTAMGEPPEVLADLAESGAYDLLVVGDRATAGPRRLLGGIAGRLARRAPTNLLIVHAAA